MSRSTTSIFDLAAAHPPHEPAIIEDSGTVSYGALIAISRSVADALHSTPAGAVRRPHFLFCSSSSAAIATYLGCLAANQPVCLLDESRAGQSQRILDAFAPPVVLLREGSLDGYRHATTLPTGFQLLERIEPREAPAPHTDLALLLTTSGSTGDPKLVRLTQDNLTANARSIAQYLGLSSAERSTQSLPMYYSYGLSLINSHLAAGAATVINPHSFLRPDFWNHVRDHRCTSFAGVPHMYETLKRLRFDPATQPTLRTLTQAGGKLADPLIQHYAQLTQAAGARFFVMYGQTEATARISYVPADQLAQKVGSIGVAIPGGELALEAVEGADGMQELIYRGPNVMLGYADSAASLALGDDMGGMLRTGDLGRVDADGFYYITGRLKRFAKLFGKRVNLVDVETMLEASYPVRAAALDSGRDTLLVFLEALAEFDLHALTQEAARTLGIPPSAIKPQAVAALPMTGSGKKDYAALQA